MNVRNSSGLVVALPLFAFAVLAFLLVPDDLLSLPAPAGAIQQASEPVGQNVCAGCHVAHDVLVQDTPHSVDSGFAGATGCEGCHGPGQAHVTAVVQADLAAARSLIFSFDGSPLENAAICLTCHQSSSETAHFDHSEHQLNGVACQDCHSSHPTAAFGAAENEARVPLLRSDLFRNVPIRPETDRWLAESLLSESEPELCFGCHAGIEGQFALPSHHPVAEGLMTCTGCHNPHDSRSQPMLRSANQETCVGCHAEKRGPFIFEHAAANVEGCTVCHTPHGSVNRMLLVRREERFLCLQCHVNPFAPNVPHGRLGFQTSGDCVRCHTAVHGSNSSPFLLD